MHLRNNFQKLQISKNYYSCNIIVIIIDANIIKNLQRFSFINYLLSLSASAST